MSVSRASKMGQQVNIPKPEDLSLIPRTHMVEREN